MSAHDFSLSPHRSAPPAPVRVGRTRVLQTVVLTSLGLVAVATLVVQVGSVDLVGALAGASPGWLALAVLASALPFVGAGLSLVALAPERVPLRQAVLVQLASSFPSALLPATLGQVAVNARYLHLLGHSRDAVVTTLALTQVSSLLGTLVLLGTASVVAGTSLPRPAVSSTSITVAAVAVVVALTVAVVPRWRQGIARSVIEAAREVGPRLRELRTEPGRLLAGTGGGLLLSAGYVLALDASLRATGITLPLATIAVVALAGTALGSAAPTPGGTGAVEAALTAGLVAAGVPASAALPAVLLFRATTFWGRVPPGWLAMTLLRRRGVL